MYKRKRRQQERQRSLYITNRTMSTAYAVGEHYLKFSDGYYPPLNLQCVALLALIKAKL